jgi:V/A-type H+-transporting ATPase subunit E
MKGIENIALRIRQDAEQEAKDLLTRAEQQAAQARADADREAGELRESLRREGEADAQRQYDLILAAQETEDRKQLLAAKQELVAKAFRRAVEQLCALEDEPYAKLLAKLAASAAETKQEKIILNQRDKARVGSRVVEEANRLCSGSLTLAEECRPIVGGLILSQGKIEVNCALDTLAALRRNELAGKASALLFG